MNATNNTSVTAQDRLRSAIYDIGMDGRYPGWKQDIRTTLDSHQALVDALKHSTEWLRAAAKEYPKAAVNLNIRAQMNDQILATL